MIYNEHSIYSIILCTLCFPATLYPVSLEELTINLNSQDKASFGGYYGLHYKQPNVYYNKKRAKKPGKREKKPATSPPTVTPKTDPHPTTPDTANTPPTTTNPKATQDTVKGSGGLISDSGSGSGSGSDSGTCASPEMKIMCGFDDNELSPGHSRVSTGASLSRYIWKDSIIPFVFDANITRNDRAFFYRLMKKIMVKSCFRFEQLHPEPEPSIHHLAIIVGASSCTERKIMAWVEAPSETKVSLVSDHQLADQIHCNREGIILHEFFHVLGIGHTHRRSDRNRYINVQEENITPGAVGHYSICSDCILYGAVPYECSSIMHYGYGTFSKDALTKQTMTAVDPSTCVLCENGPLIPTDKDWEMVHILSGSTCHREDNQVLWWNVIHHVNHIHHKDNHHFHQANHHHHHHQVMNQADMVLLPEETVLLPVDNRVYHEDNYIYPQANQHQYQVMEQQEMVLIPEEKVLLPADNHIYHEDNYNYPQANHPQYQVMDQAEMVLVPEETVLHPVDNQIYHEDYYNFPQANQHHYQVMDQPEMVLVPEETVQVPVVMDQPEMVLVPEETVQIPVDNHIYHEDNHIYHQANHYQQQVMAQEEMVLLPEETVLLPVDHQPPIHYNYYQDNYNYPQAHYHQHQEEIVQIPEETVLLPADNHIYHQDYYNYPQANYHHHQDNHIYHENNHNYHQVNHPHYPVMHMK